MSSDLNPGKNGDVKTISIISPCYNEADNVRACAEAVKALFAKDGPLSRYRCEYIFADNASSDGTVEILRELAAADPTIKVILNARNFGPFRSNFNALRAATGDAILVFLPVDLQDPPEMIPEFVKLWESGVEVVAGARANRQESLALRTCRAIFYRLVRTLSDVDIPVDVGEFQLIDRKVWQAVVQHDDHYPYIRGIIASVGFRRIIVPDTWKSRQRGLSKNNILALSTGPERHLLIKRPNAPLHVRWARDGEPLFSMIFALGAWFVRPELAPRGMTTIIFAFFFLSGMQMTLIGIFGDYITSIHSQVRKRPLVVERERLNMDAPALANPFTTWKKRVADAA